MNTWVYDTETYPNFFLAVFYNIDTKEWKYFEISSRWNDEVELKLFLSTEELKLIGFNNINYDYPLLHNTILNSKFHTNKEIYEANVRIIQEQYSAIWDNKIKIPQLDLFKIWHYDNKNKATSLKWLEFAMRSPDVRDLPYKPGSILSSKAMDEVISYCRHDVSETHRFFLKSIKHIEIRQFYSKLENINLINASEIRISKEIFTKHLAKHMNMNPYEVKKLRTYREEVHIKDVTFDYLKFNDPINQSTLDTYNESKWIDTTGLSKIKKKNAAIKFSVPYKNVIREYAEGGLHSFGEAGIYESNDEYVLVDVDFASFYPHISFKNNLHPQHIPGDIFNELYEGFYTERKNYPKSDPRNYVLKIILNGSYGLSKDRFSMLYDPKWQLAICINGQLLLTKLTELVYEKCKNSVQIIFENTDGAMYRVHRSDLSMVHLACSEMEEICKIPLEIQECRKIVARDVNNYLNIIDDENIKYKGAFEIDRDFHKNHSKRIVPLALANYFCNNVSPNDSITNHINDNNDYRFGKNYGIYDFCLGAKMKGDNELYRRKVLANTKYTKKQKVELVQSFGYYEITRDFFAKKDNGTMVGANLNDVFKICLPQTGCFDDSELSRMNRYYVSNNGYELIKKLPPLETSLKTYKKRHKKKYQDKVDDLHLIDDIIISLPTRESNLESGYLCTIFNKYEDKEDYNINYDYYINECNKIIKLFQNG